jgi:hypothetical protein
LIGFRVIASLAAHGDGPSETRVDKFSVLSLAAADDFREARSQQIGDQHTDFSRHML